MTTQAPPVLVPAAPVRSGGLAGRLTSTDHKTVPAVTARVAACRVLFMGWSRP